MNTTSREPERVPEREREPEAPGALPAPRVSEPRSRFREEPAKSEWGAAAKSVAGVAANGRGEPSRPA